jgi:hypothetical protein
VAVGGRPTGALGEGAGDDYSTAIAQLANYLGFPITSTHPI